MTPHAAGRRGHDGYLTLWDVPSHKITFNMDPSYVNAVAFTADSSRLAVTDNWGTMTLWAMPADSKAKK